MLKIRRSRTANKPPPVEKVCLKREFDKKFINPVFFHSRDNVKIKYLEYLAETTKDIHPQYSAHFSRVLLKQITHNRTQN